MEPARQEALRRSVREAFGEDIAALMALPMRESWPRLESLALEGDRLAAEALAELAGWCMLPRASAPDPGTIYALTRDTEPLDAAFLQGAYQGEFEYGQRIRAQCDDPAVGLPHMRERVRSRPGTARFEQAAGGATFEEWQQVAQAFRDTLDRGGGPTGGDPFDELSARLAGPSGVAEPSDVEALLAAVPDDPRALSLLAFCFRKGCRGIDPLPPEERLSWSLRAARAGFHHGMRDVIEQTRASDPITAYAWAGFARELIVAGCDAQPMPMPDAFGLSLFLRVQADIGAVLTDSERALAELRTRELLARYGAQAMAIQHCAPSR